MALIEGFLRALGRQGLMVYDAVIGFVQAFGAIWGLFQSTLYFSFVAPFTGRTKLRKQLFPIMSNVGVRSLPVTSLVSFLIGGILVLQTGEVLRDFGQLDQIPRMVTLSMTREMGPLMTAIIMTARVGASYTAVLASMKINEEVMALETMAIHPVGFLVAPRFLAMIVMTPCLTLFSFLIGMVGGGTVAILMYDRSFTFYCYESLAKLTVVEMGAGLSKALVFSVIISMICCHYGMTTEGGPTGLGRNTMLAVVTSILAVIVADGIMTAAMVGMGVYES